MAAERNERAVVATIGMRDPWGEGGAPTGPLLAARMESPDVAVLLATEGVRTQAAATSQAMMKELPACETLVRELQVRDPSSMEEALDAVEMALVRDRALRNWLGRAERLVVCPSSRTPQMGQALVAVAASAFPRAQFVQALDPRYAPGEGGRLRWFDPRAARVRIDVERALDVLMAHGWRVGVSMIDGLLELRSPYVEAHRALLLALRRTAAAIAFADELDFEGAAAACEPSGAAQRKALEAVKQWFAQAAKGDATGTQTLARELAAGAGRALAAGAYARAVVLLVSAWETGARARIIEVGGFDPDRGDRSIRDRLPADLAVKLVDLGDRWVRLEGFSARMAALRALDPKMAELSSEIEALEDVNELRNRAVHKGRLGEGSTGVTARLERGLEALERAYEEWGWGGWRSAPTTSERLRQFFAAARAQLLGTGGG